MIRLFLLLASLVVVEGTSHGEQADDQESPITIPLSEIIGLGNRGLRELEPDLLIYRDTPEKIERYSTPEGMEEARTLAAKSLVIPIEQAMDKMRVTSGGTAGAGFAVSGQGRNALPGIYDVLVKGNKPSDSFNPGTDVSVIFFALKSGARIRIDRIERVGHLVNIHYLMLPHGLRIQKWKLAIVPLGQLPPGEYHVQAVRETSEEHKVGGPGVPAVKAGAERRIISQPFTFVVAE